MSQRPALVTVRRPSDGLVAANPSPKPQPIPTPDEDDEDDAAAVRPPKFPPQAVASEGFPLPKARERSISKSVRIPESLLDQLEDVCRERGIEFSALVLHYISIGLRAQ